MRSKRNGQRRRGLKQIGLREVARRLDLHPDTIRRLVREERFPRPHRKAFGSRDLAWFEGDIDSHLRDLAEATGS